jgi:hypothetical protein
MGNNYIIMESYNQSLRGSQSPVVNPQNQKSAHAYLRACHNEVPYLLNVSPGPSWSPI